MEWRLSDGTTIRSGGEVIGTSYLAECLRSEIELGTTLWLREPPDGGWPLDPNDDALLHLFVQARSWNGQPGMGFTFETDYLDDPWQHLPKAAREMIAAFDAEPLPPGTLS